jgi:hypothetical protein
MGSSVCVDEAAASRGGICEERAADDRAPEERADSAREESSAHHRSGSRICEVIEVVCNERRHSKLDQISCRTKGRM